MSDAEAATVSGAKGERVFKIALPGDLVSIDSETTRDIDDALWIESSEDEHRIVVCITDVTKLVALGSTEDENAKLLGATVYVRDAAVRKMLPGHISEGRGSLIEGKPRACFVFEIVLDMDLELKRFLIERQVATVSKRLSYEDVPKILQDETHDLYGVISAAAALSHKLLAKRRKSGAMALYDLARLLYMDEDGRLLQLARRDLVVGNVIVQEMMILTNTLASGYMISHEIPGIFRNHAAKPAAPGSDQLATTIETWLRSGSMDVDEVQKTFAVLMGKAAYGASVTGHYALAQPFYGHSTSPLRRYADLANQFQLKAHLKKQDCPRSKEELEALAVHLNEKAEDRKEERSEGFKDAVKRHAAKAMGRGDLSTLADHEMVQAIKMAAAEGALPDVLVDELVDRFDRSIATDKVTDCLLVVVGVDLWAERLRESFRRWVRLIPTRAVHLLMHAEQTGFVRKAEIAAAGEGTDFEGRVTVTKADGEEASFSAKAPRKKDAEQLASTKAVLWLVGCDPLEEESVVCSAAPGKPAGNPKGALLEMCAKKGWATPTFTSTGQGPSHAMVFSGTVEFEQGSVRHRMTATGAANKKDAEAMASAQLLEALKSQGRPEAKQAAQGESSSGATLQTGNAVGLLQEQAQKNKWQLPEYTFKTLSDVPPKFQATVVVYGAKPGRFQAEGTTKQEAKKKAAEAAVNSWKA
jgi:ribonuclease R